MIERPERGLRPAPELCSADTINALIDHGALPQQLAADVLRLGDEVAWRGGWGLDAPRMVRVMDIELDCNAMAENGEPVTECTWEQARKPSTVVTLDCGRWAYGDQLFRDMPSALSGSAAGRAASESLDVGLPPSADVERYHFSRIAHEDTQREFEDEQRFDDKATHAIEEAIDDELAREAFE